MDFNKNENLQNQSQTPPPTEKLTPEARPQPQTQQTQTPPPTEKLSPSMMPPTMKLTPEDRPKKSAPAWLKAIGGVLVGHQDFFTRLLSLLIAVLALGVYQSFALGWQAEEEANQAEIAEAEAHNAEITAMLTDEEDDESASVSYVDGVYTGSAEGFGGEIEVEVTVQDGEISGIEILSSEGEDDAYFSKALTIVNTILSAQSTDVDTVSGATFSSTGIRDAVEDALKDAVSEESDDDSESGAESDGGYADGTYTGSAEGFGGEIEVEVTVEDGEITNIDILSAEGEDDAYFNRALSIVDTIRNAQSTDVDTVSGATFSSTGIRDAVAEALEGATE